MPAPLPEKREHYSTVGGKGSHDDYTAIALFEGKDGQRDAVIGARPIIQSSRHPLRESASQLLRRLSFVQAWFRPGAHHIWRGRWRFLAAFPAGTPAWAPGHASGCGWRCPIPAGRDLSRQTVETIKQAAPAVQAVSGGTVSGCTHNLNGING
jgi:hypothetical protein